MKLLIKNGVIVNHDSIKESDILIEDNQISEIDKNITVDCKSINAKNKYIFPGVIDSHVHLNLPMKTTVSKDDYSSGTKAGLFGGVTSVIDFFPMWENHKSIKEAFTDKYNETKNAHSRFSFHFQINNNFKRVRKNINQLKQLGVTSVKTFFAYEKNHMKIDDEDFKELLLLSKGFDFVVTLHAEVDSIILRNEKKFVREGKLSAKYFPESKPLEVELKAVEKALKINDQVQGNLYFVHTTNIEAVELINSAKTTQNVFVETCPQYLFLNKDAFKREDNYMFAASPPLREPVQNIRLIEAVSNHRIDTIATDHCPFTISDKIKYKDDFRFIPNGLPGIENLFPLMFDKFLEMKEDLTKLTGLLSFNPAKIFKLKKLGQIKKGFYADLIITDPSASNIVDNRNLHSRTDFNPYIVKELKGKVETVIINGKLKIEDGELKNSDNEGFIEKQYE